MSWMLGALGGFVLFLYGVVPTFQPSHFHRIYAAYGGIFIVMAVIWGWIFEGIAPDIFDIIGCCNRAGWRCHHLLYAKKRERKLSGRKSDTSPCHISAVLCAAIAEIGGGYLVWLWLREKKTIALGALGGIILFVYGIIPTL